MKKLHIIFFFTIICFVSCAAPEKSDVGGACRVEYILLNDVIQPIPKDVLYIFEPRKSEVYDQGKGIHYGIWTITYTGNSGRYFSESKYMLSDNLQRRIEISSTTPQQNENYWDNKNGVFEFKQSSGILTLKRLSELENKTIIISCAMIQ